MKGVAPGGGVRPPPSLLLANRLGTATYVPPGASVGTCSKCGVFVHLAPSSRAALEVWPKMRILCLECGLPTIAREGLDLVPIPGQAAELRAASLFIGRKRGSA